MSDIRRVKGRNPSGRFIRIPYDAWRSPAFASLTPHALKLLIDIAGCYNGKNNGDLSAAFSVLSRERYWKSRDTLGKAVAELLRTGFLIRTRRGKRLCGKHEPSLYAVTWWAIDPSDKHNMQTATPPHNWKRQIAKPSTPAVSGMPRQARPAVLGGKL